MPTQKRNDFKHKLYKSKRERVIHVVPVELINSLEMYIMNIYYSFLKFRL